MAPASSPERRPPGRATPGLPRLALTPGEPAGIGPDLLVRLIQTPQPAQLVAVADPALLTGRARALGLPLTCLEYQPGSPREPNPPGTL